MAAVATPARVLAPKSSNIVQESTRAIFDPLMKTPDRRNGPSLAREAFKCPPLLSSRSVNTTRTTSDSVSRKRARAYGAASSSTTLANADESDIIKNGRTLLAATTTALAAPAEIHPSKRRKVDDNGGGGERSVNNNDTNIGTSRAEGTPDGRSTTHIAAEDEQLRTHTATPVVPGDAAGTVHKEVPATPVRRTRSATKRSADTSREGTRTSRSSAAKRKSLRAAVAALAAAKVIKAEDGDADTQGANAGSALSREEQKRARQEREAQEWRNKYLKAFPGFVFYFDAMDDRDSTVKRRQAEHALKSLGSLVEPFFSRKVTHVVTTRPMPPREGTATNIFTRPSATTHDPSLQPQRRNSSSVSPTKPSTVGRGHSGLQTLPVPPQTTLASASRQQRTGAKPAMRTPPKQKLLPDNTDRAEAQDILQKASAFGMKIWSHEKLLKMVVRLLDNPADSLSANHRGNAAGYTTTGLALQMNTGMTKPSLPSLLRAEALTGTTYERDLSTLRPDYNYFSQKHGYLLVEDSLGDYQPAHVKEYTSRVFATGGSNAAALLEDREVDWPVLHGGKEGSGAFFRAPANHKPLPPNHRLVYHPNKFWGERTETQPWLAARTDDRLHPHQANLGSAGLANDDRPYHLRRSASTSAIAPDGRFSRKLSDQSSRRDDAYLAASGNSQALTSNIASATSTTTTRSGQVIGGNGAGLSRHNSLANGVIIDKRLARLGSKAQKHVVTLGGAVHKQMPSACSSTTRGPPAHPVGGTQSVNMKRSVSLDSGLNAIRARKPPQEAPKKPGYCENCRVRYEDFKAHCKSRKHRKFALDQNNWLLLDELFTEIARPLLPELVQLYEAADTEIPSDIEASDASDSEMEDEDDEEEEEGMETEEGNVQLGSVIPQTGLPDRDLVKEDQCNPDDSGWVEGQDNDFAPDISGEVRDGASLVAGHGVSEETGKEMFIEAFESDVEDEQTGDVASDDVSDVDGEEEADSDEEQALFSEEDHEEDEGDSLDDIEEELDELADYEDELEDEESEEL